MTRYFALALNAASAPAKIKSQVTYKPKHPAKIQNWGMFIAAALVIVSIVYLVQINSLSTKGYEIKRLEQQLVGLKESNERLELEARALKSLETIQSEARLLNFVPGGNKGFMKTETNVSYR